MGRIELIGGAQMSQKSEVKEEENTPRYTPEVITVPEDIPLKVESVVKDIKTGETMTQVEALAKILNDLEKLKKLL